MAAQDFALSESGLINRRANLFMCRGPTVWECSGSPALDITDILVYPMKLGDLTIDTNGTGAAYVITILPNIVFTEGYFVRVD